MSLYAENNEKRARRPFVRYQSRLELVNQTQSYDVISVDASVTSELVVVQQVDFVVNVGGHVFVEVVGRTNINIFQDIFVVVVTTSNDTRFLPLDCRYATDGRRPKSNWY